MRDSIGSIDQEMIDLLDKERAGINVTGLCRLLPHLDNGMVKSTVNQLYLDGRINRLSIMGVEGRYYVFFSLYVRTANGYAGGAPEREPELATPPPPPPPPPTRTVNDAVKPEPVHSPLAASAGAMAEAFSKVQMPAVAAPAPAQELSAEQAQAVIQHLEWDLSERRRAPNVFEIIERWKLPYRLSRIVEIAVGGRRGLSKADAALVARLAREQMKR